MTNLAATIESILFASGEPVPIARISLILEKEECEILEAFNELDAELKTCNHGLKVFRLGEKIQICSDSQYAGVITKVLETRKPPMLSNPALETLSVIAYFQPATLAYISKVRGVDSTYTVSSLTEKGLVEEKGRLDAPGRPILYGTTDAFLRTMGITALDELPALPDLASNSAMEELKEKIEHLRNEPEQSYNEENIIENNQTEEDKGL